MHNLVHLSSSRQAWQLDRTEPASAGTYSDSCCAQASDKRNAVCQAHVNQRSYFPELSSPFKRLFRLCG